MDKATRKQLRIGMKTSVMPKIKAVILDEAKSIALEMGDMDDPFIIDEAASAIIKEICEFLAQGTFDDQDAPLLHPRQMTDEHFEVFWVDWK